MKFWGSALGFLTGLGILLIHSFLTKKVGYLNLFFYDLTILFLLFWLGRQYDLAKIEINERKVTEIMLKESEDRYRSLVELSPQSIVVHQNDRIVYANPAALKMMKIDKMADIIGRSIYDFIHPDFKEATIERLAKVINGNNLEFGLQKGIRSDGQVIDIESSAFQIMFMGEQAILSVLNDVTERRKAEEKMNYMAFHDALTKLPNRYALEKYINDLLIYAGSRISNTDTLLTIMFIDLDRFKLINDSFGHSFGDLLLKEVANRLKNCLKNQGVIFRYGGDEFIIILHNTTKSEIVDLAENILEYFHDPFIVRDQEVFTSPSIGISVYPFDGEDKETLIKNADTATYYAKELGKNNYQFYNSTLNKMLPQKMKLENELRKAIDRNEFKLFYQPQINLNTGEIVGLEALIRWKHPNLGLIPPGDFIPLAEETGLIVNIGQWVIKTACQQVKLWQEKYTSKIRISVNVSVRQFKQKRFVEFIENVLEETGLEPQSLDIEITESIMQNINETYILLKNLRKIGVKISVDDFGTGYSSLSLLRDLPIDNIKIDQSFVANLHSNQQALAIIKTIIDMGKNLHLRIIAEGIETEQQAVLLQQVGCTLGQGYYFGKPIPPEEVDDMLAGISMYKEDSQII